MSEKELFPEEDELVVATVESITRFGSYLKLEDYPHRAFLPLSEVSTRWIRKITDVIRSGQRVVVKVIRVDKRTKSIDVSLKDVPASEGKKILAEWERNKKGEKLLRIFSEKKKSPFGELLRKLSPLIDKSPTIYDALERIVMNKEVLKAIELSEETKEELYHFLTNRVKLREYVFKATVSASFKGSGGVSKIKHLFERIEKEAEKKGLKVEINLIASPKYMIKLSSHRPEVIKKNASEIIKKGYKYSNQLGIIYKVLEEKLEK